MYDNIPVEKKESLVSDNVLRDAELKIPMLHNPHRKVGELVSQYQLGMVSVFLWLICMSTEPLVFILAYKVFQP